MAVSSVPLGTTELSDALGTLLSGLLERVGRLEINHDNFETRMTDFQLVQQANDTTMQEALLQLTKSVNVAIVTSEAAKVAANDAKVVSKEATAAADLRFDSIATTADTSGSQAAVPTTMTATNAASTVTMSAAASDVDLRMKTLEDEGSSLRDENRALHQQVDELQRAVHEMQRLLGESEMERRVAGVEKASKYIHDENRALRDQVNGLQVSVSDLHVRGGSGDAELLASASAAAVSAAIGAMCDEVRSQVETALERRSDIIDSHIRSHLSELEARISTAEAARAMAHAQALAALNASCVIALDAAQDADTATSKASAVSAPLDELIKFRVRLAECLAELGLVRTTKCEQAAFDELRAELPYDLNQRLRTLEVRINEEEVAREASEARAAALVGELSEKLTPLYRRNAADEEVRTATPHSAALTSARARSPCAMLTNINDHFISTILGPS